MSTPFPSPPPAAAKPQRKIWPWALGGCLVLLLLGALAVGAMLWFGVKQIGGQVQQTVTAIPGVSENFGVISDAGMDLGAMGTTPGAMVFNITGEKGTGTLVVQIDPQTRAFQSATLTLPSGEKREIDIALLRQLEALSQGQVPVPPN